VRKRKTHSRAKPPCNCNGCVHPMRKPVQGCTAPARDQVCHPGLPTADDSHEAKVVSINYLGWWMYEDYGRPNTVDSVCTYRVGKTRPVWKPRRVRCTIRSHQHTTVIIARVSSPRCFHSQESTARSSITVTNKYVKPRKMIFLQGVTIIALQLRRVGALIVLKCAYNSIDQYIHVCIGPIYSLEKRGKTHCFAWLKYPFHNITKDRHSEVHTFRE
jgi:hypothetical protein